MQSLFSFDENQIKIAIALVYFPHDTAKAIELSGVVKPYNLSDNDLFRIQDLAVELRENIVESANFLLNYAVLKSVEVLTSALTVGTTKERLRAAEIILNRVMGMPKRDTIPNEGGSAANMVFINGADVSAWQAPAPPRNVLDIFKGDNGDD